MPKVQSAATEETFSKAPDRTLTLASYSLQCNNSTFPQLVKLDNVRKEYTLNESFHCLLLCFFVHKRGAVEEAPSMAWTQS